MKETFYEYFALFRPVLRSILLPAFAFALDYFVGSVVAFDSADSAAAASTIGFVAGSSTVAYSNIVGFVAIAVPVIVDPVIAPRQWTSSMCPVPFSLHAFRLCLATEPPCWRNSATVPTVLDPPAAKYPSNRLRQLKRLLFVNTRIQLTGWPPIKSIFKLVRFKFRSLFMLLLQKEVK